MDNTAEFIAVYMVGLEKHLPDARHLHGGLIRYLVHHINPGHFLTAVLENNLVQTIARGDDESIRGLNGLVVFLYNYMPSETWGNPDKVRAWIEMGYQRDEDETDSL